MMKIKAMASYELGAMLICLVKIGVLDLSRKYDNSGLIREPNHKIYILEIIAGNFFGG